MREHLPLVWTFGEQGARLAVIQNISTDRSIVVESVGDVPAVLLQDVSYEAARFFTIRGEAIITAFKDIAGPEIIRERLLELWAQMKAHTAAEKI